MTEFILIAGTGLLLVLAFVILSATTSRVRRQAPIDKLFVQGKWQQINELAQARDKSARYAVIEADKLLDYALKQRGYSGETMGERLKAAANDFSYTDDIWSAHKLRNKLVHEADYEVDQRLVRKAVQQLQTGLKDLGAF